MIAIALILLFLAGFFIVSLISEKFSLTERIGFGFPVGLGIVTFIMMIADWFGGRITTTNSMILTCIVCAVAFTIVIAAQKKKFVESLVPTFDFSWFNLLWVLLLFFLIWVEYHNFAKCMYFPTYDRDSMAGFDTIGYLAAQEHTYKGLSIFTGDYMPRMHNPGSCISYLPMLQFSYAYIYSLGAETSKAIPAFFYLSFIIAFYGMAKRTMSHTAAMFATLAMVFTPEMISFSSLSATNVMQAAMASTGLIYVCMWCNEKKKELLVMGALLLAINHWLRAEGIVFGCTAGILVLLQCVRKKAAWSNLIIPILTLIPTITFMLYSASCNLTSESAIITRLYWDAEKAGIIYDGAWKLLSQLTFYGWAFLIMLIAVIANGYYSVKEKDNLNVLLAFCLSLILYYFVLYHVDYKWDSINNVLAYSAKRFMFCYVPIAWYYTCNSKIVQSGFNWIEKTCGLK